MFLIVTIDVSDVFDKFGIGEALVGLNTGKGEDLPQGDGKRPNIRFAAKFALNSTKMQSAKCKYCFNSYKPLLIYQRIAVHSVSDLNAPLDRNIIIILTSNIFH